MSHFEELLFRVISRTSLSRREGPEPDPLIPIRKSVAEGEKGLSSKLVALTHHREKV